MALQDIEALRLTAAEATHLQNTLGADHPASKFLANVGPAEGLALRTSQLKRVTEAMKAECDAIETYDRLQRLHGELADREDLAKKAARLELENRDLRNINADQSKALNAAVAKNAMAS